MAPSGSQRRSRSGAVGPHEIGDEVDRSRREHDPVRPGELACPRQRGARLGLGDLRDARASARRAPRGSRPGRARGFALCVKTTPAHSVSSRSSIGAACLSSSTETTATSGLPARNSGSDSASAAMPGVVVGAVEHDLAAPARIGDDLEAAGDARRRGRGAHRRGSQLAEVRLRGRAARRRSCAAGSRRARAARAPARRHRARRAPRGSSRPARRRARRPPRGRPDAGPRPARASPRARAPRASRARSRATVEPSQRVCSRSMFVSTAIGASMTFVASQRPPSPASTTAACTSAPASCA